MKFADTLFQLYLRHFDNKESLEAFIHSILEQMDQEDLMEIFKDCKKEELDEILGSYLNEELESKLSNKKVNGQTNELEWRKVQ